MKNLLLSALALALASCSTIDMNAPASTTPPVIGAVGCSMMKDLGRGLALDPDNGELFVSWDLFTPEGKKVYKLYSGGTLNRWYTSNNKMSAFENGMAFWGADMILWMICSRYDEIEPAAGKLHMLQYVRSEIELRAPGTPVYITLQPVYEPGHFCDLAHTGGADAVAHSDSLIQIAIENGLAIDATDLTLGPLGAATTKDGCHVNSAGRSLVVSQMKAWLSQ